MHSVWEKYEDYNHEDLWQTAPQRGCSSGFVKFHSQRVGPRAVVRPTKVEAALGKAMVAADDWEEDELEQHNFGSGFLYPHLPGVQGPSECNGLLLGEGLNGEYVNVIRPDFAQHAEIQKALPTPRTMPITIPRNILRDGAPDFINSIRSRAEFQTVEEQHTRPGRIPIYIGPCWSKSKKGLATPVGEEDIRVFTPHGWETGSGFKGSGSSGKS